MKKFLVLLLMLSFYLISYSQSCFNVNKMRYHSEKGYSWFPKKGTEDEIKFYIEAPMQLFIIRVSGGTIDGKTGVGYPGVTQTEITVKIKWDKNTTTHPNLELEGIACNTRDMRTISFLCWDDDVPIIEKPIEKPIK